MSELRDRMQREAEAVTPSPDWHAAVIRRAQRRSRLRRIQAGSIALILTAGGVTLSMQAFGGGDNVLPAQQQGESNYLFSNVRVHDPKPPVGSISFEMAWSSDSWPGIHRCTWTAYGEGGTVVGENSRPFFQLDRSKSDSSAIQELGLDAPAERATAECDPRRLDVGNPYAYEFDVLDVTSEEQGSSTFWNVHVDMTWLGEGHPGVVDCVVSIEDGDEIVTPHEIPITHRFETIAFVDDAPASGGPYDAQFECREHGTDDPFEPSTRTDPPEAEEVVHSIGCFSEPSPDEGHITIVATDGRSPTTVCAEFWERGQILVDVREAPDLIACTPPTGETVWVFPGDDGLCAELDLEELPEGYEQAALRFAEMQDDMIARFPDPGPNCLEEGEARRVAREVLDAHGFSDWRIEEGGGLAGEGFSESRPCAGLSFNVVRKVLVLVPEEKPS